MFVQGPTGEAASARGGGVVDRPWLRTALADQVGPSRGPLALGSRARLVESVVVQMSARPITTANFDDRPHLVFWETTKACPLACVHCRAFAQPAPLPGELTTGEGVRLIDELASGPRPRPILVLTGGDCLSRGDVVALAAYGQRVGVPVAIAPSVSPRMTPELLRQLHAHGVTRASLSLDGATPETHEGIRQVAGHFEATIDAIKLLAGCGFQVQINTTVMTRNVRELAEIAALVRNLDVGTWEVFFLISVGRGRDVEEIGPHDARDVAHFLVDAAQYGMLVRTVEAPFFRGIHRSRAATPQRDVAGRFGLGSLYCHLSSRLDHELGPPTHRVTAPTLATRDGKGIIFVAHDGAVYPSGFLPLSLGNVREAGLLPVYREHALLRSIRAAEFPGRCGSCSDSDLCGGSRARAYARTGDALADDPACVLATTGSG